MNKMLREYEEFDLQSELIKCGDGFEISSLKRQHMHFLLYQYGTARSCSWVSTEQNLESM